ncbi:unnamed protein product, partial [Discosporangium mesarthrocarpum]
RTQVSWRKPLLLGNEELRPFLTREEAAFKIQQLHGNWKSRETAREHMRQEWSRVFSPQEKRYYFFYHGKSPLILPQKARWRQPCRSIGGPWVWRPVLTEHMAALRIQNMWRAVAGMRGIRNLIRQAWAPLFQVYSMENDPITGEDVYRSRQTGEVKDRKPLLLGKERWDPADMLLWGVDEVVIFIRRCGLRVHAGKFRKFNIDGALLMTFDPEDFQLLGISNTVQVKKVLLEIERREAFVGYNTNPKDLLRRAALRQRQFEDTQAVVVQRWWRELTRKRLRKEWKRVCKTMHDIEEREAKRKESRRWWTDRVRDYTGLNADIKVFGRRCEILGVRGWGHWKGEVWVPAPEGLGEAHRSRLLYRDGPRGDAITVYRLREQLEEEERVKKQA